MCVVLYLNLIKEVPGFFLYSHTHKRVAIWLCLSRLCVCVIVCFVADPGLHSQACTLSTEPWFERGHYPPWVCTTVPFPPLSASEKQTHTLRDQSSTERTALVQKSPLAWTDITGTQMLCPPEPVSVHRLKLYWFELKMPFSVAGVTEANRQRHQRRYSVRLKLTDRLCQQACEHKTSE